MKSFRNYVNKVEPVVINEAKEPDARCIILSGSLKSNENKSNSNYLSELVVKRLNEANIETEIVYLHDIKITPGVEREVNGEEDDFTKVIDQIKNTDILIIATPIWWGIQSSLVQAVIERLTWFDDEALRTNKNLIYGKVFGCIISGADDGWQHVQGNLYNFASSIGFTIPPDAALSSSAQGKEAIDKDKDTQKSMERFCSNMIFWGKTLKQLDFHNGSQLFGYNKTGYISGKS